MGINYNRIQKTRWPNRHACEMSFFSVSFAGYATAHATYFAYHVPCAAHDRRYLYRVVRKKKIEVRRKRHSCHHNEALKKQTRINREDPIVTPLRGFISFNN